MGGAKLPPPDKNPNWTKTISELAADVDVSWQPIFKHPTITKILAQLDQDFDKEMKTFGDFYEILPMPPDNIFNAFKKCAWPPKVVICGQDPFYKNLDEAMGLAFSVPDGVKIPPTLVNIYKELSTDIKGFDIPLSGNLTQWAHQNTLLLNTSLTVRHEQKESHLKLWKPFTDAILHLISETTPTPIVFMLWGAFAQGKKPQIMGENDTAPCRHLILEAAHPSPLSAYRGWFGCKHFSQCNNFLISHQMTPINWSLSEPK